MDKKDILKKENFEIATKKELKKDYKYVYRCNKCHKFYGSDKKELTYYLCPICEEEKISMRWKKK